MHYFLDSNIFLRYFAKEADLQVFDDCSKLIIAVRNRKIKAVTSHIVVAEVVWVLTTIYKVGKEDQVEILKSIENIPNLKIVDKFQISLANELYGSKPIKYIDALIASVPQIQSGKWTLVSYDKDFDKLGVLRKEPSNFRNLLTN